jgi:endonuclease YncB( thermonuclease family)
VRGFVRVIDGDSVEAWIDGKKVATGLLGVVVPTLNNDCGRQARDFLESLIGAGLRLGEDPAETFDERGRRMYRAMSLDGRSVAQEMVRVGAARASGKGA